MVWYLSMYHYVMDTFLMFSFGQIIKVSLDIQWSASQSLQNHIIKPLHNTLIQSEL